MNHNSIFKNKTVMAIIAIFCCLLWGSAFPVVKTLYTMDGIQNIYQKFMLAGTRFFIAGMIVLIFAKVVIKTSLKVKKENIGFLIVIGIIQTFFAYMVYYIGMNYTTGSNAAILSCMTTFFVAVLSKFFFKNFKFTIFNFLGLIIGFTGVMVLNIKFGQVSLFKINILGDGFIILQTLFNAIALIIIKKNTHRMNVILLTGYQFIIGGFLLMLVAYINYPHLLVISKTAWILLLYSSLVSAIAFSLWFVLMQYHDAPSVSLYQFTIPIFGTLLSILLIKQENFTPIILIALVMVATGILVFNIQKRRICNRNHN